MIRADVTLSLLLCSLSVSLLFLMCKCSLSEGVDVCKLYTGAKEMSGLDPRGFQMSQCA